MVAGFLCLALLGCGEIKRKPASGGEASVDWSALAPGQWEITTTNIPRAGLPMRDEPEISSTYVDAADAARPPVQLFLGGGSDCVADRLSIDAGRVDAALTCPGQGGIREARMRVHGTYDHMSFQVTVETDFLGFTLRQERRGRHVRS